MKRRYLLCLALLVFLSCGCKGIKKEMAAIGLAKKPEPKAPQVASIELAEAILRPKPFSWTISRDPFKPLVGKASLLGTEDIELLSEKDIEVIGILKGEDKSVVLLELPVGMGVFREGDRIDKYILKKIDSQKVILETNGKELILELGGEK